MSSEYRPPSSRRCFVALGIALSVTVLVALRTLMFSSGMIMHGDP